ncbi:unnamed protein product [Didymodactylos carnosus]|uniref:RING-type domain-containing protein n=1 Tax=Didymodactylos carnosus TaxID=1234261 RepID=A0A815E8B6_9BILA|nr:unnamed protein product [Didymodactylos carnosus]CAF4142717.1 unnamed protein product [Didymodactylos carnosus]
MVNCCYNRSVDLDELKAPSGVSEDDRIIGTTSSISNYVDQRNKIVYVDTIGYGDVRFHQDRESFLLFFRELICYSSIGYNWLFLFIRYQQLSADIFVYIQTLEQLLGEKAFTRCSIVFTHCKIKGMTRERCIEANKEHDGIVRILKKFNNIIFGDMDTDAVSEEDSDSDDDQQAKERLHDKKRKQRTKFMNKMLTQIDHTDETILSLEKHWYQHYWTKFTSLMGYYFEKVVGKPNELSKLYKLAAGLKKDIPVTIYYEECSICLELIIEIVDHSPKACITKCGHVFHYDCLRRSFDQQKKCPNCRKDLRSLPEKVSGLVIGLKQVQDPLKSNVD